MIYFTINSLRLLQNTTSNARYALISDIVFRTFDWQSFSMYAEFLYGSGFLCKKRFVAESPESTGVHQLS